jgi:hypothetical protein
MERSNLLAVEIADRLAIRLNQYVETFGEEHCEKDFDKYTSPLWLLWMCERIGKHYEDWPVTKLHRWVGYIQGVMVANGMSSVDLEKQTVQDARIWFPEEIDQELDDHNNPDIKFRLDIGGES